MLMQLRRSIPPSERIEKTRSGYVIPSEEQKCTGRERDSGEEGGRLPAQHSLYSHFSVDTMCGIRSGF